MSPPKGRAIQNKNDESLMAEIEGAAKYRVSLHLLASVVTIGADPDLARIERRLRRTQHRHRASATETLVLGTHGVNTREDGSKQRLRQVVRRIRITVCGDRPWSSRSKQTRRVGQGRKRGA